MSYHIQGTVVTSVGIFISLCLGARSHASDVPLRVRDLSDTADRLVQIAEAAASHERNFENLRVNARLEPSGETIHLTLKGTLSRLELDMPNGAGAATTSFWLDDGFAAFSSSRDTLIIEPPMADRRHITDWLAGRFWLFQMAEWEGKMLSVSQFCLKLAEDIRSGLINGKQSLVQVKTDGEFVVVIVDGFFTNTPANNYRLEVTLDPKKSYVMTSWVERDPQGKKPTDYLYERQVVSNYSEVAPGVYFVSDGVWSQSTSGTIAEELNQVSRSRDELVVNSVEFGDFELPSDFFDVHRWPAVRKGMDVVDRRVKPHLHFVYGEGPYDESVLDRVVAEVRTRQPGNDSAKSRILIYANVVAVVVLLSLLAYRRKAA